MIGAAGAAALAEVLACNPMIVALAVGSESMLREISHTGCRRFTSVLLRLTLLRAGVALL